MSVTRLASECPKCGSALRRREGKNGGFLACTGYPRCNFTEDLDLSLDRIKRQIDVAESDTNYLRDLCAAVADKLDDCPSCRALAAVLRGRTPREP